MATVSFNGLLMLTSTKERIKKKNEDEIQAVESGKIMLRLHPRKLFTHTHMPSRNVLLLELNPDGPRLGFL